jgi:hypothetical protein
MLVADLMLDMPNAVLHSEAQTQKQLFICYCSFIWAHHIAGTSGS